MLIKQKCLLLLCALFPFFSHADVLALRDNYPKTYVVKKGDTLWDISAQFLNSPWLWPRLWQANTQIENPHLIYPGERLNLVFINGEPRLVRKPMVSLSPKVRVQTKPDPIPTLPLSRIGPFLIRDHVAEVETLSQAPYILGSNEGSTRFLTGHEVFISGALAPGKLLAGAAVPPLYGVYRPGRIYRDPETGEALGQEIRFIAMATIVDAQAEQPITTVKLMQSVLEAKRGDKILPLPPQESLPAYFLPKQAEPLAEARIIATFEDRKAVGKLDVVIINKGEQDKVSAGDMFAINTQGKVVVTREGAPHYLADSNLYQRLIDEGEEVYQLPDERIGELMVFKVYQQVSLALITQSTDSIKVSDRLGKL